MTIQVTMRDKIAKKIVHGSFALQEGGQPHRSHVRYRGRYDRDRSHACSYDWVGESGYKIFNGGNKKMRSTLLYRCQFEANGEQMMVYTKIIAFSMVRSENMPLLHVIHLEPDGLPCHRQFNKIQYHRLRVEETDHIEIHLTNTFNKPMDLETEHTPLPCYTLGMVIMEKKPRGWKLIQNKVE